MKTSDLRITSGLYKGQRLHSPESAHTHPMGAREKLALFNMLQPFFLSADAVRVLDLYAGSGALGIEALSRGAQEVVFVEKSPRTARVISNNLASLQPLSATTKVFPESVSSFCTRPEYMSYFDIIIADPPYDNFHPEDLVNISSLLTSSGVLALSSPANLNSPLIPNLSLVTSRTYAAARITLYRPAMSNY